MSTAVRIHVRRNLIGYLALFVALGGTAWAAQKVTSKEIAKNAVRAKHVKGGQIGTSDLRDGGVESADIGPGQVDSSHLLDGSVTGDDIAESSLGAVPNAIAAETATSAGSAGSATTAGNADTLDGRHAVELETPVAFAAGNADPEADTQVASVDVEMDAPGRLVAIASIQAQSNGGEDDGIQCRIRIAGQNGTDFAQDVGEDAGAATFNLAGLTLVESRQLTAGTHAVSLRCGEIYGEVSSAVGNLVAFAAA